MHESCQTIALFKIKLVPLFIGNEIYENEYLLVRVKKNLGEAKENLKANEICYHSLQVAAIN
jgi:hypothetical protein